MFAISLYNPGFNYGEFATIRNQVGLNSFKVSVKEYTEKPVPADLQIRLNGVSVKGLTLFSNTIFQRTLTDSKRSLTYWKKERKTLFLPNARWRSGTKAVSSSV